MLSSARSCRYLIRLAASLLFAGGLVALSSTLAASDASELEPQPTHSESPPGAEASLWLDERADSFADTRASNLALAEMNPAAASAEREKQLSELRKAVSAAYAPLFFNNKYEYLNHPLYDQWFPGDRWKQLSPGGHEDLIVDLGGQFRMRQHTERNFRGVGLSGRDDDFLLYRARLFANARYRDVVRVYVEGIDAESNHEEFAPRPIEVNRAELLNLFADAVLHQCDTRSLTFRVGRQELAYGAQRLISPLDWSNTRRTFEGINFLWRGDDWDADVFAVEPVTVHPEKSDSADDEAEFFGAYTTYKAIPDQKIDLFALQYNNSKAPRDFRYTTLGARWQGTRGEWLWEGEGGVQFGDNTDGGDHSAGYWTIGGGHKWEHCWKPVLWVYYDWASGGDVRGAGQGFDHLFPLAHKYLGYMDLFARSNIQTPNAQFTFSPRSDVNVLIWYYYLMLENATDTPYNVNMVPYQPGHAPPSRELGHEIDLTLQYVINPRMDILVGYSHFFAGAYFRQSPLDATSGVLHRGDADFFYTQFTWNF